MSTFFRLLFAGLWGVSMVVALPILALILGIGWVVKLFK